MSWRVSGQFRGSDPDAYAYIAAVEQQDNQALENGVKFAINNFVVGCKDDGIWNAIKASCILAGARTLAGALVPLVGTAPTNFNFVSGDYDRKTGLKGDGSTKYLNSNRTNNADPQNSKHVAVYINSSETRDTTRAALASRDPVSGNGSTELLSIPTDRVVRINRTTPLIALPSTASLTGLYAGSRSNVANFIARFGGVSQTISDNSSTPTSTTIDIFTRNSSNFFDGRLSFYSIGEALDLALLDTRTTRFMAEIQFAINTGLNPSSYNIDTLNYVNAGYAAGGTLA